MNETTRLFPASPLPAPDAGTVPIVLPLKRNDVPETVIPLPKPVPMPMPSCPVPVLSTVRLPPWKLPPSASEMVTPESRRWAPALTVFSANVTEAERPVRTGDWLVR